VFWPLQSNSEFLGVPEDSQVPFSGVWVATSHLPQSGVATERTSMDERWWTDGVGRIESNGWTLTNVGQNDDERRTKQGWMFNKIDCVEIKWIASKHNKLHRNETDYDGLCRRWRSRAIHIRKLYNDGVQKINEIFFKNISSSLLQRILQLVPLIIRAEN
jgi:hypothetical protein